MSLPSWISTLNTSSIAADMGAAEVNGVVTEAGLTKLMTDLDATLSATSTLTTAELNDLKTIAANLNNGLSTSSYLSYVFNALVNGNAANALWTGGQSFTTGLGNLVVGSNAIQVSELTGKWLLGTDLPSSQVNMTGYSGFSVSYSSVSAPLFGVSGPKKNDINQGYLGDCYFLSSCAEVAQQNQSDITSMFTNNGNGTYGVRFYYHGVAEYVTVNGSLADGGYEFNHATDIWASLAEKAYAQFQALNVETGNSINGNSYNAIGNGGMPADALEALTGATAFADYYADGSTWTVYNQNASLNYTNETSGKSTAKVLNKIINALSANDDIILSSMTDATDASGKTTLVSDHAMSIFGYDNATCNLEIRNPWGKETWQNWDTTFEISLTTLLADGDMITIDNAGVCRASISSAQPVQNSQANVLASADISGSHF